jgi:hypothetical protein
MRLRANRSVLHVILAALMTVALAGCSPNRPSVGGVTLRAEPAAFPATGGDVLITALVATSTGTPIPGVEVEFSATAGRLSADKAGTDQEGIARVVLASSQSATVTARVHNTQAELQVRLGVGIDVVMTPPSPRRNEVVTIDVSVRAAGQPASGGLSLSFGDGTSHDFGNINGSASTTHQWTDEGGYNVSATLRQGNEETRHSVRVEVQGFGPLDDQIDPALITWLSPATTNISNWAVTSEVKSVSVNGSLVCIDHTKAGVWPLVSIDGNAPNIEGNILIVANINGQWYGGGFDWMGGGRICKAEEPTLYGADQIRVHPLDGSWPGPRSGDVVGLLISAPSSNRIPVRSVLERTNIVLFTWP